MESSQPSFRCRLSRACLTMREELCYTPSTPMPPSRNSWRKREPRSRWLFMAWLCLVGTACSATPPTGTVLFDDARGRVSLRRMADRSFQAGHPINLEPDLLAHILRGVQIQEQQRALQNVLAGSSSSVPVFSEEQIRFLAPLLAEGLRTAAPDQRVEYRVHTPRSGSAFESSTAETTAGSLYAYGLSLYLSLSHYRSAPGRTTTEDIARRRLPDASGLSDRALLFSPASAQRSDSFHRPAADVSGEKFLVIDYQLLQGLPAASPREQAAAPSERQAEPVHQAIPAVAPSDTLSNATKTLEQHDEEIRTLKDLVIKKDVELELLRKELQSIRKQLDSQKRKNKPPSR